MSPAAPRFVDRYRIERSIGKGGMGEVFEAFDPRLNRRVAIKVVSREDGADAAVRVTREAQAAARLSHPNAVAIYDVGVWEGIGYIAMELIPGSTLRSRIAQPDIGFATRARWLMQLADALGAAHRLGIVHRDVKPDNVLVDATGQVKVLDFGVAKVVDAPPGSVVAPGTFCGTPRYMAPEQLTGLVVDGRTDQFAWGLVAFELLSRGHRSVVQREPGRAPAKSLGQVAPDVPNAVVDIVTRTLSAAPSARFAAMEEISRALAPFAGVTLDEIPPPMPQHAKTGPMEEAGPTTNGASTRSIGGLSSSMATATAPGAQAHPLETPPEAAREGGRWMPMTVPDALPLQPTATVATGPAPTGPGPGWTMPGMMPGPSAPPPAIMASYPAAQTFPPFTPAQLQPRSSTAAIIAIIALVVAVLVVVGGAGGAYLYVTSVSAAPPPTKAPGATVAPPVPVAPPPATASAASAATAKRSDTPARPPGAQPPKPAAPKPKCAPNSQKRAQETADNDLSCEE